MNAWYGHYAGKPHAWFLVVAATRAQAERFVLAVNGEPDRASMRSVREALFEFTSNLEPEEGGGCFVDCGMGPGDGIVFGDPDTRRILRILQPPNLDHAKFFGEARPEDLG